MVDRHPRSRYGHWPRNGVPHWWITLSDLAILALAVLVHHAPVIEPPQVLGSDRWPASVMLRHIAAAPNCNAARAVGLAPARWGEPGYYPWHDRDKDGIACEPWPRSPLGNDPLPRVIYPDTRPYQ